MRRSKVLFVTGGVALALLACLESQAWGQCLGFGSDTPGGSNQPLYRVTNLKNKGAGSLRDAVSQGNRYIVFDVAGEIKLEKDIFVKGAFITIDGNSAPAPGITLKHYGLGIRSVHGAHDVIVRGIRVRDSASDGFNVKGTHNVVLDHVSSHNSADGNLDITDGAHDISVCWSVLAEPAGVQKNNLIKYGVSRVTLHNNLYVDARQRNPQVRIDDAGTPATDTTADIRNNVIWNWSDGLGTLVWFGAWANIVNNFYSGPLTPTEAIRVSNGGKAYVAGNFSLDGWEGINETGTEGAPFPAPALDPVDACNAAHAVRVGAGAMPRDEVDTHYVSRLALPAC